MQRYFFSEVLSGDDKVVLLEEGPFKLEALCKTLTYTFSYYDDDFSYDFSDSSSTSHSSYYPSYSPSYFSDSPFTSHSSYYPSYFTSYTSSSSSFYSEEIVSRAFRVAPYYCSTTRGNLGYPKSIWCSENAMCCGVLLARPCHAVKCSLSQARRSGWEPRRVHRIFNRVGLLGAAKKPEDAPHCDQSRT